MASSSNSATTGFRYCIQITDVASGELQQYFIAQRQSTYLVFRASAYARQYCFSDIKINQYSWKQVGGLRKFKVEIGEDFGTVPSCGLSTNYFYAWDGVVDYKEFPIFDAANYIFGSDLSSSQTLTNKSLVDKTFYDRSNYLYLIGYDTNNVERMYINTYNSTGTLIQAFEIVNPTRSSATDLWDRYYSFDIGWKGLDNIGSVTSGTLPIITDDVEYYEVLVQDAIPARAVNQLVRRIFVERCSRFDTEVVHYVNKRGGFETLYFEGVSEKILSKESKRIGVIPFRETATPTYEYSPSSKTTITVNTNVTEKITLKTDWLSEEQVELYSNLFASPLVYLDRGWELDYLQITPLANSFLMNKRYNNKLYQISMDFEFSGVSNRQSQ